MEFYEDMLELHDNHTFWKINVEISYEEYCSIVKGFILEIENRYKGLEIFELGRSGRHICIEDTPVNRRRYKNVQAFTLEQEEKLVSYINSLVA